jgi:hypothetical protein
MFLRLTVTGASTLPLRIVLPTDEALRAAAVFAETPGATIVVEPATLGDVLIGA